MLRTAGVDAYNKWITHELPFMSPEVKNALDVAGKIFFTPGLRARRQHGHPGHLAGRRHGPHVQRRHGQPRLLDAEAGHLVRPDFFPDAKAGDGTSKYVIGEDVGLFYLPAIDPAMGTPALGAGDALMVTADRPEVRAVAQFLSMPEGIEAWVKAGSALSANQTTPAEWYAGNYKLGGRLGDRGQRHVLRLRCLRPDAGRGRCRVVLDRHGRLDRR